MSVIQLPETLHIQAIENNSHLLIAKFTPENTGELQYITVNLVLSCSDITPYSTETLKLKLMTSINHSNITTATAFAESNDVLISSITTTNTWLGYVRFDFDLQNIYKDSGYYLYLIADNYTESGARIINVVLDTVGQIYSTSANIAECAGQFILYLKD